MAWSYVLTLILVNDSLTIYFLARNNRLLDQFQAIEHRRNRGRYLTLALETSPIFRSRRYEIHNPHLEFSRIGVRPRKLLAAVQREHFIFRNRVGFELDLSASRVQAPTPAVAVYTLM